ncbi:protein-arginine deiminase domain-containing protein [Aspergillus stella-maris]|uniref:protein-arginine deiminase domain-containing protein n=1 Tax=Aspergillus stella-maris TaxID=1810926 RepID=UPI003CCD65CC
MWSQSTLRPFIQGLLLANAVQISAVQPDIRADTNRDGTVDLTGSSDLYSKSHWSDARGAIFLPNVGDKYNRCPNEDMTGNPLSNDELAYCNDASGHLLLAPEYIAPIRTMPMPDIEDGTTAHVYATPRAAYERVRIFLLDDLDSPNATDSWRLVDRQFNFNATQLRAGLVLGIDGREFVKDKEIWDGHVTVNFDVYETPGLTSSVSDSIALKVAPVLTHHHLQRVEQIVSTDANETDPVQRYFVSQLDTARKDAGVDSPLLLFNQSSDVWTQDILEPAYVSMPGPEGPISLRIMLRSAQSTRTGGRQIMEQLRGAGMGSWQPSSSAGMGFSASGFGYHTMNSYGNLETIPPYTSKSGVKYKAGRVIQGKHYEEYPAQAVRDLVFGQGVQNTLFLETGWLRVGHVDEFVQFLPYDNELSFTIGIASPRLALDILSQAQEDGHGDTNAISFDAALQVQQFDTELPSYLNETINTLLANETFLAVNDYAQKWIDHNLDILLADIPLARSDVISVPGLYVDTSTGGTYVNPDGLNYYWPPVLEGEYQIGAFIPSPVNGVVVGRHYISPDPFGPVVGGVDIIKAAVLEAYAKADMNVSFVDDYFSHHTSNGEVHCGSNTLRQTDMVWWQ